MQKTQEVDFYWQGGEPLNVCWDISSPSTRKREINGLLEVLQALHLPSGRILTRDHAETIVVDDKRVEVTPAWQYFLEQPER
ncbi:MAG: hypothetical protein AAGJ82_07775 [Bacteroidota bacterium]